MRHFSSRGILQDIHNELTAAGGLEDGASTRRVEVMLRHLAEPKELRLLINYILTDKLHLAKIATQSYYHANNFLKLVLIVGDRNSWKLRLHIWPSQPETSSEETEDIHSHRWDFTTALVLGEYCAREFRIGPGDEYHHYKYRPVGENQAFSMEARGSDRLSEVFEASLPTGTVYHLNHQVLHKISRSDPGAAATLLVQGPPLRNWTDVYRTSPAREQVSSSSETRVQRPSADLLRTELMRFLDWL